MARNPEIPDFQNQDEIVKYASELLAAPEEDLREDLKEAEPLEIPRKESFPTIMLTLSAIDDAIDIFAEPTGVGQIYTKIAQLFITAATFIWLLNKGGGGYRRGVMKWVRRRALKQGIGRWAASQIAEMIPFVGVLPISTLFVWMTHHRDTKLAKTFFAIIDAFHKDKGTEAMVK